MTEIKRCIQFELACEQDSEQWAKHFAFCLAAPLTITLSGEIGTGKTTIVRAMLRSWGVTSTIKSPTFSLLESYIIPGLIVHHADLYRIHDPEELDAIGFRDYFTEDAVCCIEWPERAPYAVEPIDLALDLKMHGDGRMLHMDALTAKGVFVLSRMGDDA